MLSASEAGSFSFIFGWRNDCRVNRLECNFLNISFPDSGLYWCIAGLQLTVISFQIIETFTVKSVFWTRAGRGGGGTLGNSVWGCAAGTLELLTFTRASSAEFFYPILE